MESVFFFPFFSFDCFHCCFLTRCKDAPLSATSLIDFELFLDLSESGERSKKKEASMKYIESDGVVDSLTKGIVSFYSPPLPIATVFLAVE